MAPCKPLQALQKHAVNRAIERDILAKSILDALLSPLDIGKIKITRCGRPSQRYIGQSAEVVINPSTKKVVSVNPTSSKKAKKLSMEDSK